MASKAWLEGEGKARFWLGAGLQTGGLVIATLLAGVPMGFFQSEIAAAVGPFSQEILFQAVNSLATFVACASFAFIWVHRVYLSTVIAFIGAEVAFWFLSLVIGSYEQPKALMIFSLLLSFGAAIGGAYFGLLARRMRAGDSLNSSSKGPRRRD